MARPRPRSRRALALAALLVLALAGAAGAVSIVGGLQPLGGPGGCLLAADAGEQRACGAVAIGLDDPAALLLVGASLYVASPADGTVLTLTRAPATGLLSLPRHPTARACAGAPDSSCASRAAGLEGVDALAASPDGADLYAGSADGAAVVALRRGPAGVLVPLPALLRAGRGRRRRTVGYGCVDGARLTTAAPARCAATSAGLQAVQALAVSPDGRDVYAVSSGQASGQDSVVALARDQGSGGLSPLHGLGACVESHPRQVCSSSTSGLEGAAAIAISRDGRFVYVASALSGAVVGFARDPRRGTLTPLAGLGGCVGEANATPPGTDLPPCPATGPQLSGARALALSPDGRFLYVAAFDPGALLALPRDPLSGRIGPPSAPTMCLSSIAVPTCQSLPALRGADALALAPSGRLLYVSAAGGDSLVEVLADPATGALTPATAGVRAAAQLGGPGALAASADGRTLYVASPFDDALAGFSTR